METQVKIKPKCYWCGADAKVSDYREIDGQTSKIKSCLSCLDINTRALLKRKNGKNNL